MPSPPPGPASRADFIEHTHIVIKVQVIMKMGRRYSPDPYLVAGKIYDAITMANCWLPMARAEFCTAVSYELGGVFCNWERGKPKEAKELAAAVYDALAKASVVPVIGEPRRSHSTPGERKTG